MSIATELPREGAAGAGPSSTTQAVLRWLHESAGSLRRLDYAVSALDWCRRMPELTDRVPTSVWQRLLNHLLLCAAEADTAEIDASRLREDSLIRQLLAGELALTLATPFPRIKACRRLLSRARRTLSTGLTDLLDGEGLLHAGRFDQIDALLACWTRCRKLGRRWKRGSWSDEAEKQYRRFVRSTLRFVRRDGSAMFSERESANTARDTDGDSQQATQHGPKVFSDKRLGDSLAEVLRDAVELIGEKSDRSLAAVVLSERKFKEKGRKCKAAGLPKVAIHSEWAATALLRPDWSPSSPRLAVLYPDSLCRVEMACGKDVLWSGAWTYELRVDGMAASPVSDWTALCWVSDEDVDYLELEIELVEGFRIQRHIVMARKDRFALLADAVLGPRRAALDYRSVLPLGRGINFLPENETHEATLAGQKHRALAMPLALPEWRGGFVDANGSDSAAASGRRDSFQAVVHGHGGTAMELRRSSFGRAIFAPIFFDLDRRRFDRPRTWRQLTVADSLTVRPADAAVGYRVSMGSKNWLIYRSLTAATSRTLLGHHLSSETLIARLTRKGEVRSLIEIE